MSIAERLHPTSTANRVTGLLTALVAWVFLYQSNEPFWDWLIYERLQLAATSSLGSSVHFFAADTVKITLLLVGIIFIVTVLRSFMTLERTRAMLGGKREGIGNALAGALGVVTPFCSCSAVPAFIGFVAAGVPLGVTLSFLISSPLVNEIAVGLLWTMFGFRIALIYIASGLFVAIVGGWVLGRLKLEQWVEPFVFETRLGGQVIDSTAGLTIDDRIQMGVEEVISILRKIWPYLMVGIGLGAVIHGWAPTDLFTRYASASNPLGVLVAVLIGIPLYSNAAGVMPLVQSLYGAGLPMGTLLAFMMAVVALSLPEMILLRRVLKPQLIATYIGVVGTAIVGVGYLFNLLLA